MKPHSRLTAYQSKKFTERRKVKAVLMYIFIAISIFSWIFTLSRLSMLSVFTIDKIEVSGTEPSLSIKLQATVLNAISGDYLGIFSRSNTLLYPHDYIVTITEKVSPQIENVKIVRNGTNSLNLIVKERDPAAVICANLPDFSTDASLTDDLSSCYLADDRGYIYKKILTASNNPHNIYYIPALADSLSSTTEAIVGIYATSTELFIKLQDLYSKTIEVGIPTIAILIKEGGEYELYASNTSSTNDPMVIYLNDSRPITDEFVNLFTFWKRVVTEAKNSGKNINFEYIDVRYGSNVFYRKMQ